MNIVRAVLYCRVSRDQNELASVHTQERESLALCERQGWPVGPTVVDNDIGASRHSKKKRPGFDRLETILQRGDVLVVWEGSRVTREGIEHHRLMNLCEETGVYLCVGGTVYNPAKPDDRMSLGISNLVSAAESDRTREQVLRDTRRRASAGLPHGRMPFGYRKIVDPRTGASLGYEPDPQQAPIVREAAGRIIAGESLYAICHDLNQRGVPDLRITGSGWESRRLRKMILSPTYAGLRQHQGKIVGPASWPAIITEAEHSRIVGILTDPSRRFSRGNAPVHLLSGIALCGVCGHTLKHTRNHTGGHTRNAYHCLNGCVYRRADPVDQMVETAIMAFFGDEDVGTRLASGSDADDSYALLEDASRIRHELQEFYVMAAQGKLSATGLVAVETEMLGRISDLENQASTRADDPCLLRMVGPAPKDLWDSLSIRERRSVVRAVLEIRILVPPRSGRTFLPEFVEMSWRV